MNKFTNHFQIIILYRYMSGQEGVHEQPFSMWQPTMFMCQKCFKNEKESSSELEALNKSQKRQDQTNRNQAYQGLISYKY